MNPHIAGIKVRKLIAVIIHMIYTDLSESGLSTRSVQDVERALHIALKHALRQGLVIAQSM